MYKRSCLSYEISFLHLPFFFKDESNNRFGKNRFFYIDFQNRREKCTISFIADFFHGFGGLLPDCHSSWYRLYAFCKKKKSNDHVKKNFLRNILFELLEQEFCIGVTSVGNQINCQFTVPASNGRACKFKEEFLKI
jgi:hypothetical protein